MDSCKVQKSQFSANSHFFLSRDVTFNSCQIFERYDSGPFKHRLHTSKTLSRCVMYFRERWWHNCLKTENIASQDSDTNGWSVVGVAQFFFISVSLRFLIYIHQRLLLLPLSVRNDIKRPQFLSVTSKWIFNRVINILRRFLSFSRISKKGCGNGDDRSSNTKSQAI